MDAFDIRRRIIKKLAGENVIVISGEDKLSSKLSRYTDFAYMVISREWIKYIVHEAQDSPALSNDEKIVTYDPDGYLEKIAQGKRPLSPHPELVRGLKAEKIEFNHVFRKPYDDEVSKIKEAAGLLDRALGSAVNRISIGMREYEIRAEIDYEILRAGFENFTYPTVVLSGERTSIPLGKTSDRKIESGDVIQIDVSPVYMGYEVSLARVIFTDLNDEIKEIWKKYNRVFEIVSPHLKPGTGAGDIDSLVRDYLSGIGYSFPHYSGYPLGGFTAPYLFPGSKDVLERNTVLVFSPGIYVKGKYGFRIKRMIHITDNSFETLDRFGE